MQAKRKLITAVLVIVGIAYLGANAQDSQSRIAHSSGQGTLKVGDVKLRITSVIVKLVEDHKVEVTLVSDITFFLNGKWSGNTASQHEVDLEITGGATGGGLAATGKVVLGNDGKSVARLNLKGISQTTKKTVEVNFKGK